MTINMKVFLVDVKVPYNLDKLKVVMRLAQKIQFQNHHETILCDPADLYSSAESFPSELNS